VTDASNAGAAGDEVRRGSLLFYGLLEIFTVKQFHQTVFKLMHNAFMGFLKSPFGEFFIYSVDECGSFLDLVRHLIHSISDS